MVTAREFALHLIRPYCSSELEEIDIFLALQEALANAVLHGCQDSPSKTICCRVDIDAAAFTITIRDPGPGFDPEAAANFTEAGATTTEHGRGIRLMRSLMNDVTYGRGGSEVCLGKTRAVPATP